MVLRAGEAKMAGSASSECPLSNATDSVVAIGAPEQRFKDNLHRSVVRTGWVAAMQRELPHATRLMELEDQRLA